MTYGEFLRHCMKVAGCETKNAFATLLGMKDPDHFVGATNDRPDKKPSLELLEKAAKAIGLQFDDFIQLPKENRKSREDQKTHRELDEIFEQHPDDGAHLRAVIETFHRLRFRRR